MRSFNFWCPQNVSSTPNMTLELTKVKEKRMKWEIWDNLLQNGAWSVGNSELTSQKFHCHCEVATDFRVLYSVRTGTASRRTDSFFWHQINSYSASARSTSYSSPISDFFSVLRADFLPFFSASRHFLTPFRGFAPVSYFL